MNDDKYQVLLERVESIQKSLDRIDRDLAEDRRDIQQFTIRVGALESQVDEMRKLLGSVSQKVKDGVEDAIEPLTEAIERKTIIKIIQRPWWVWFRKEGK